MIAVARPSFALSSGAIEAAKWIAVFCMVVDHVNAALYGRELGWVADALGRIAFPLFAIILGVNLGNGADKAKVLHRLCIFGVASLPFHSILFAQLAGWWPLNVMWTFAVAVMCLMAWELGRREVAAAIFIAASALVEYWWPGVALVLIAYHLTRKGWPPVNPATWGAVGALCVVNGNLWAFWAIFVLFALSVWSPNVPRAGRFFWWFYPVHLAALAVVVCMARV